jgi:hypothetical protein
LQNQTPHIVDTKTRTDTDRAETDASIDHVMVTLKGVLYEEKLPYVETIDVN